MSQFPEFVGCKVTPIKMICDTSRSMETGIDPGDPHSKPRIDGLNEGLAQAYDMIRTDRMLGHSAQIGITTISDPIETHAFKNLAEWLPPKLVTSGGTPFGQALLRACDDLAELLQELNSAGRPFNRPTVLILSDGEPYGESASDTRDGIERVKSLEKAGKIFLIPAGITEDDCRRLDGMGFERPAECVGKINWRELFRIVTASAGSIARGQRPMP